MARSEKLARRAAEHADEISQAISRKRVIIYCRVSTDKQEQDGESLDYQEEKCRQYAQFHGYEVVLILKEAKSGFIHYSHREKLSLARQYLRDGLADILIVWDLRRLSRNFVHSAMIFEEIEQAGGSVSSVTENIDDSLTGKLIRSILSWSAESERHKIVEYANRHWQARLENNLPIASGRPPYGWTWGDKDKTFYILNPEEAAVRYSLFYMFCELDMSLRAICHKLTEDGVKPPSVAYRTGTVNYEEDEDEELEEEKASWYPATVHNLITDDANIGILTICKKTKVTREDGRSRMVENPNRKQIPGGFPVIVPIALYERAQMKLKTNREEKSHPHKNPEDYLLKSHIYCRGCGCKMIGVPVTSKGYTYALYRCNNHQNKYAGCPKPARVSAPNVNDLVWEECCHLFERFDLVRRTIEEQVEQTVQGMLENTQGKQHILALAQDIAYAEEERAKHPKGSYYYNIISKDIAEKQEKLQKYQESGSGSALIVKQVDLYKERVFGFLDFLNVMRGRYHEATFQEKRNAIEVLGVKVIVARADEDARGGGIAKNGLRERVEVTYSLTFASVQQSLYDNHPPAANLAALSHRHYLA